MNDIDKLNELLRSADTSNIHCEACGKLSDIDDTASCDFCNREYICSTCQIWYKGSINEPLGDLLVLPSHYKPYYKNKNLHFMVIICRNCHVDVEALYVKSIPITQIPKYLNFHFIHESSKALLLQRASIE